MTEEKRMPVLFIGHGSPMNAIEDNVFSQTWVEIAKTLPVPRAILCISAHWETNGTFVSGIPTPRTIHDFYGFPQELNEIQYPAQGSPELAQRVSRIIKKADVGIDLNWGLDHGAWSVLRRMYPEATIPVLQLSLHHGLPAEEHYALGQELQSLRDQGILILGSGNMVHNLALASFNTGQYDWAVEFDQKLRDWIVVGNHDEVIHYERHGRYAELAVNSAEHYLPLLYVLGAGFPGEPVLFYNDEVMAGAISMRCVRLG